MTTEILSAALRTSSGIVIPLGSRTSVLADLHRRRDKAIDLLYAAEDAGDERKWRAATERFWLRELQIDYLDKRPADALCPQCVLGDEDWQPDILTGLQPIWSCLEHWTPALEREAASMGAAARWFGAR